MGLDSVEDGRSPQGQGAAIIPGTLPEERTQLAPDTLNLSFLLLGLERWLSS